MDYYISIDIWNISLFIWYKLLICSSIINYFIPLLGRYEVINGSINYVINIPFLLVSIIILNIYLVLSIVLMVRYRSIFEKKQFISMAFVPILINFGIAVEILTPQYLVSSMMFALCASIVQNVLESPEDLMLEGSLFYNYDELSRMSCIIYIAISSILGAFFIISKSWSTLQSKILKGFFSNLALQSSHKLSKWGRK